ncbi:hypothetical protein RJT34_20442 [Clitoria ternatea]|uniref:Protein EARLY RESPONSIVE TO DEHYDRATION 15 n=1 Tax=Clitoria ternatea TaxID=43366 RepID=A0AAN9P5T3_CLITE
MLSRLTYTRDFRFFLTNFPENKDQKMALVSGGRSTLNPNAPLYIPAAFREVEDFSPEWWQLVTTLTWYHDYWLSVQQEDEDGFGCNDVVDLLPDSFDVDASEDELSVMEAQLEEFIKSYETQEENEPEQGAKTVTA